MEVNAYGVRTTQFLLRLNRIKWWLPEVDGFAREETIAFSSILQSKADIGALVILIGEVKLVHLGSGLHVPERPTDHEEGHGEGARCLCLENKLGRGK